MTFFGGKSNSSQKMFWPSTTHLGAVRAFCHQTDLSARPSRRDDLDVGGDEDKVEREEADDTSAHCL